MQVNLRDLHVSYRDYDPDNNPPVLHHKDVLVMSELSALWKVYQVNSAGRGLGGIERLETD